MSLLNKSLPKQNNRKFTRYKFIDFVRLALANSISENNGQGIDISSQGIGIVTPMKLGKGDVLKALIPAKTKGILLPVISQVVWVKKRNKEYRVGLQFLV